MFCALSGETPSEPVVSKKTGHVFEQKLIQKFLETNGKCPITGESMTMDDLIVVNTNKAVKPRPVSATSIPGLLATFQNEWDALMLETYTLKQTLDTVRQELSHALYQHDAACRVIARLIKERDSARAALASAQVTVQVPVGGEAGASDMDVDAGSKAVLRGISEEDAARMTETSAALSKTRKKREISAFLAKSDEIAAYSVVATLKNHKAGIDVNCVAISADDQFIATGAADGDAALYHRRGNKVTCVLSGGHTKPVNDILFHPSGNRVFTASSDRTVRTWEYSDDGESCQSTGTIKAHSGSVVGLALQATGNYLAAASADNTWSFIDIASSTVLASVAGSGAPGTGFSSIAFHPDGLILGTGTTDAAVRIWDVKSQACAHTFEGHSGVVMDLAFSENGYYMASASADGTVKFWDLRKLAELATVRPGNGAAVRSVSFDYSGSFISTASTGVSVYAAKSWNELKSFAPEFTAPVVDVAFGKDARYLAAVSADQTLKILSSA